MINIYVTDSNYGFLYTSDKNGHVIYGEVCSRQRLSDLLGLAPEQSDVTLYVDNESQLTVMSQMPRGQNLKCSDYVVKNDLDVVAEVMRAGSSKVLPPNSKFSKLLVILSYLLCGILAGLISGYFLFASNYFVVRQDKVDQVFESMQNVHTHSTRSIDGLAVYNEVIFAYSPKTVEFFEVEKDDIVTIIFTSTSSGLRRIPLTSLSDDSLEEGQTITIGGEAVYLYTLTGKLIR